MKIDKRVWFNLAVLVVCMGLTIFYVFHGEDFSQVYAYVSQTKGLEWMIGIGMVIGFILCESLIIHYLMAKLQQKVKWSHCCLYSFVGFFFSLVTPTASGGQPMQLIFMGKDKVPVHLSTMVLMIITIMYKAVLVILGLGVLLVRPARIMELLQPAMGWVKLGIVLNVLCVGFIVALVFCPDITKKLVLRFLEFLSGIFRKNSKKWSRWKVKAEVYMDEYKEASIYMKAHKGICLHVFLISAAQRCLLFAVTYVVFRSFGITRLSWAEVTVLQGMISLAVDMLPLPGGMGISEHLFDKIFLPICGTAVVTPAMIVTRGLSFYSQLFLCACFTVVAYFVIFGKRETKDDRIL